MSHSINLDGLSREDLLDLSKRIEQRLLTFPGDSGSSTESARAGYRDNGIDVDDPWAAPCLASTIGTPRLQATLSEKIQELNYVNDPWEGTGIGPTRWSLPFYGGHIARTPEDIVRAPYMASGPATLPVFGPPCQSFGGPPGTCGNSKTHSDNTTDMTMDAPAPAESPRCRWSRKCPQLCGSCYSPCCFGHQAHGLHACERHRME